MEIETVVAAIIGAVAALLIGFVGLVASVHTRLGKLETGAEFLRKGNLDTQELVRSEVRQLRSENEQMREQMRLDSQESRERMRLLEERLREQMRLQDERTRELIRSESEQTRGEIRRLADALVSHNHDSDGTTLFRIPPA